MKKIHFWGFVSLLAGLVFSSCKKENTTSESQGTNFTLLLKTVKTYNYSGERTTTLYTYNAGGKVTTITTKGSGISPGDYTNTETFTRNAAGLPENIELLAVSAGSTARISTQNSFDLSGKTIRTIQQTNYNGQLLRDSSVYTYSGNILQQRTEYRSINGGPYSLLVTAKYQISGAGNLDRAIFVWTTPPSSDTLNFTYDDKINSLPIGREDNFYWTMLYYDDLKSAGNVTQFQSTGLNSYTNEYRYSSNNKPLYRKTTYPGTANYDETYYYYD
jgi:hypothetical protein